MPIVIDGDARTFRAAAYGRPHEGTVRFLQRQFEDPSLALRVADTSFLDRARAMFDDNYGDEAMARIEAVRNRLRRSWNPNTIFRLETVEEFQQANPLMQRWVMAQPFVRQQFKRGAVSGYLGSYVDLDAKFSGKDHYDWRRAMSGMAVYDDENGWLATTYGDEELEGDEPLSFEDKLHIQDTWEMAEYYLMSGKRDITSPADDPWG
ncbi:hypothetical protein LUCX_66 [Xanthomonas phage vB_XciM_LucasX]|nr:hypothetical protein LUCX_66 [Xanthomonas phage vB_XciM_LucasX]